MTPATQQFTATQIARALGWKRQAVQRLLADIAPTGLVMVAGNPANGWALSSIPGHIQTELQRNAERRGYRDTFSLLSASEARWEPTVPLSEAAQHCVDKAAKLQRALNRVLSLQNNLTLSTGELEQIGLDDYAREFGHPITDRYLRELIKRTIDRDRGANNFSRLEIYLDDNLARKVQPKTVVAIAVVASFRELPELIATFKNPANPTSTELEYLWLRSFELLEENIADGTKPKKARLALLKALWRCAPFLAESPNALRVSFKRKYERWLAHDRDAVVLVDKRKTNSGYHRAPELSAEDRDKLIAHSVLNCGGRVSQAWRELSERNGLSEQLLSYHIANPASKSYCPDRIRDAVQAEVDMMGDIHHGPRTAKLNGAHLSRDWSGVAPMDWLCADDVTLEVYFYIPDGTGGFILTRGQLLLMIDVRTTRILGYALLPEKTYNARAIRTLITKISDEHGLPRKGFYFERGIWAKSRLLKGDANAEPFSWGEAEVGLRGLGLKFVHSRLPRSKPVERVIGAIQDLMDGEPGFVGGNEMKEKFERVQLHKRLVETGKDHPSKYFLNLDEWTDRLDELFANYNSARQDGKITGGLSPDAAFDKLERRDDPPLKLSPGCRYLLSHHKRPLKVTSNGITLRFGKQVYNYRDAQTGRLVGEMVLAWFNPETPEILSVTDMNRENPFCVARAQDVPAMDAPRDLLEQEMQKIEAHNSYAKTRYRILKARYSVPFRRSVADADTVALGVEIAQQQNELSARQGREAKQKASVQKSARKLRMNVSPATALRPETAESLKRLAEILTEPEQTPNRETEQP